MTNKPRKPRPHDIVENAPRDLIVWRHGDTLFDIGPLDIGPDDSGFHNEPDTLIPTSRPTPPLAGWIGPAARAATAETAEEHFLKMRKDYQAKNGGRLPNRAAEYAWGQDQRPKIGNKGIKALREKHGTNPIGQPRLRP